MSFLYLLLISILGFALSQAQTDCSKPPPGWPRRPPNCCELPFPLPEMKSQFGACIRQIAGRPSSAVPTAKSVRDTRLCIEECVYKGIGFMSEEEKSLEKEEITKKLKQHISGQNWESSMESALENCFKEDHTKEEGSEESTCSPVPHSFTRCVLRQLFLNCPNDKWNDSEECQIVKNRMKECPQIPPPPPPPPQRFQQRPRF